MRGDEGNHHQKWGLIRISCASVFPIPDTADESPDPVCNHTDTRSSHPNRASSTTDFSYPHESLLGVVPNSDNDT